MLVVGDRATTDSLASVLTSEGFQVLAAADSSEAIALTTSHQPAVAVVDNQFADHSAADLIGILTKASPRRVTQSAQKN